MNTMNHEIAMEMVQMSNVLHHNYIRNEKQTQKCTGVSDVVC